MTEPSRNVSAKEAVTLIRGPLPNKEIMEKFRISPKGFADLLKQLFAKKLISEQDLERRGIQFKVVKKEASPEPDNVTVTTAQPALAPPALAPRPRADDSEFLDTVTLTEMLKFKGPDSASAGVDEIEGPDEEVHDIDGKKGRFTITGLFKKS
ncbi:MAG: hypothetical protein AB1646_08745 [Thermodesulfobacteriota bacterium]